MGLSPNAKKFTIINYPKAFKSIEQAFNDEIKASVVIIDFSYIMKWFGEYQSGEEFILRQVLPEFTCYFERGCKTVILVFDTKSPANKYEEHMKRYSGVIPVETPRNVEDIFHIISVQSKGNLKNELRKFISSENGSSIPSNRI